MEDRRGAKRILIVDDEGSVGYFLKASLNELHTGYQVETARSGRQALQRLQGQPFDLVVTDLKMPGMDGLALMEQIRERYPRTRLILMTGYGSPATETAAYRLGACRYINKPFSIDTFRTAVSTALAEAETPRRDILMLGNDEFDQIAQCLADLQFEVGAQCILLANVAGQMMAHVGETADLDLPALISLIGGGFVTALGMGQLLGESQAVTLNYHEGERYDVYSANVNHDLFVVLIFDRQQQRSRVGMVWLYTRRVLSQLQDAVRHAQRSGSEGVLDADFGSLLSDSFDQLWTDAPAAPVAGGRPAPGAEKRAQEAGQEGTQKAAPEGLRDAAPSRKRPTLQEMTARLEKKAAEQRGAVEGGDQEGRKETFGLQQALELGLLDPSWLDGSEDETGGQP